jgi:hypothetical protein
MKAEKPNSTSAPRASEAAALVQVGGNLGVLAGDNAVVIAHAAAGLPPEQRRRVIIGQRDSCRRRSALPARADRIDRRRAK